MILSVPSALQVYTLTCKAVFIYFLLIVSSLNGLLANHILGGSITYVESNAGVRNYSLKIYSNCEYQNSLYVPADLVSVATFLTVCRVKYCQWACVNMFLFIWVKIALFLTAVNV